MMSAIKVLQNRRGQTIVESLVGFALIGIIGMAFVGGMVSLRSTTRQTVVLSSSEKQIKDIADNIKAGVENYQINFNYDKSVADSLDIRTLPMGWDNGVVAPRDQCPGCAGTYGYVIQPYEEFRGLYRVTLRMTHKAWLERGEKFRDYVFVVSAK